MISGSDTLLGMRNRVRNYIHEKNTQTSWWTDEFIDQVINSAYKKRCTQLISAHEGYFTNTLITPVIAEEPFYSWPSGFERLIRLDLKDLNNDVGYPLERWERRSAAVSKNNSVLGGYLPTYRPVGGGFNLEPPITEGLNSFVEFEAFDSTTGFAVGTNVTASLFTGDDFTALQLDKLDGSGTSINATKAVTFNFDGYSTIYFSVYIPSVSILDVTAAGVYCYLYTGASASVYTTPVADLVKGWNTITVTLASPDSVVSGGCTLDDVDAITIGFGVSVTTTEVYGLLIRSLRSESLETASVYNLELEYVGLPVALTDDAQTLHPEFPVSMDELLVLDAACALFASESAIENGTVRALARERAEWDATFARYVDSRIVTKERVDPFVGPYADA